jgi:regulator of sirC expression with transglutaminase-like and TPR domain
MNEDAKAYLGKISSKPDDKIEVVPTAVALAALERPELSMDRYLNHLKSLVGEVKQRHRDLLEASAGDTVETQLAALKHVLSDSYGYKGIDDENSEFVFSDILDVIDNRKGSPLSLCLLYMHAGRALKWDISVMRIPGHNVLSMDKDGRRVIFDPSEACKILQASDLRAHVKKALGEDAELSADYYEPTGNRELLIRFQNVIKFHRIEMEDYEGALNIVQGLRIVDPREYRLLLDAGVLLARSNRPKEAIDALENYIEVAPDREDREDAALLLQHIRESIS